LTCLPRNQGPSDSTLQIELRQINTDSNPGPPSRPKPHPITGTSCHNPRSKHGSRPRQFEEYGPQHDKCQAVNTPTPPHRAFTHHPTQATACHCGDRAYKMACDRSFDEQQRQDNLISIRSARG